MRPHLLRLGELPPRLDQQPYCFGSVGGLLGDVFQYRNLLPDLAQKPFGAVRGAAGQRSIFVERFSGKRYALEGVVAHGRIIAEQTPAVNASAGIKAGWQRRFRQFLWLKQPRRSFAERSILLGDGGQFRVHLYDRFGLCIANIGVRGQYSTQPVGFYASQIDGGLNRLHLRFCRRPRLLGSAGFGRPMQQFIAECIDARSRVLECFSRSGRCQQSRNHPWWNSSRSLMAIGENRCQFESPATTPLWRVTQEQQP